MKDQLEIVASFDDDGEVTKATWQWRHVKCAKNGTCSSVNAALHTAVAARKDYIMEQQTNHGS